MIKTVAVTLLKLAALTAWIAFVSLFARNLTEKTALDEHLMVDECKREVERRFNIRAGTWSEHYYGGGSRKDVLLVSASPNEKLRVCQFNNDKTLLFVF